jgi:predicted DNA-binding transcriptional regulator AlpA
MKSKVHPKTKKAAPREGTMVVWPSGIEEKLGISAVTRWRWEKSGKLPPRDFLLGDKSGWRVATIEAMGK